MSGERHKQFAVLPNYTIEISQDSSLNEQKFEAELAASTPPPPHLPTIAADLLGTSTRSSETKGNCSTSGDNNEVVVRKNETTVGQQRDEGAREYMETRFFGKLDPEESLAVMTETEERESEEEDTWADARAVEHEGNQEREPQDDTKGSHNQMDGVRSPEQLHGGPGKRLGASGGFHDAQLHAVAAVSRGSA